MLNFLNLKTKYSYAPFSSSIQPQHTMMYTLCSIIQEIVRGNIRLYLLSKSLILSLYWYAWIEVYLRTKTNQHGLVGLGDTIFTRVSWRFEFKVGHLIWTEWQCHNDHKTRNYVEKIISKRIQMTFDLKIFAILNQGRKCAGWVIGHPVFGPFNDYVDKMRW